MSGPYTPLSSDGSTWQQRLVGVVKAEARKAARRAVTYVRDLPRRTARRIARAVQRAEDKRVHGGHGKLGGWEAFLSGHPDIAERIGGRR